MFKKTQLISALVISITAGLLAGTLQAQAPRLVAGDMAPAWQGKDMLSGQNLSFPAALNNKPAVLVFWATWCPYCKAFMPYAKAIQADFAQAGVQILTFNAKERGKGDPLKYAKSLDFPMVAIADADAIAERYTVKFIPGLMVVDGNGKIVYRRGWTELPAGKKVAQQWSEEVRDVLENVTAAR